MIAQSMLRDSSRRQQVIEAAWEEFSHPEDRKVSTNLIVQNVAMAKELPWHDFTNKRALFDCLVRCAWPPCREAGSRPVNRFETDLLRRWTAIIGCQIALTPRHPHWYDFFLARPPDHSHEAPDSS